MIKGEPGILSMSIDLGSAYTLQSPNYIVTKPDGTTDSGAATVSPLGTTSANPHTFSFLYVPTQAGPHKVTFEYLTTSFGSSQTLRKSALFWASWSDVYTGIRTLLGVDSTGFANSQIDFELYNLFTEMYDYTGKSLPLYNLFNTTYQDGYDRASIYLISSRVRPQIGGRRPSGEVSLFKKGTTTVQYSQGPKQEFTVEQMWYDRGIAILDALIPEISKVLDADRIGDEVGTRGELALGNYHPRGGWRVSLEGSYISYNGPWGQWTGDFL